jgi:hypothetical protein
VAKKRIRLLILGSGQMNVHQSVALLGGLIQTKKPGRRLLKYLAGKGKPVGGSPPRIHPSFCYGRHFPITCAFLIAHYRRNFKKYSLQMRAFTANQLLNCCRLETQKMAPEQRVEKTKSLQEYSKANMMILRPRRH